MYYNPDYNGVQHNSEGWICPRCGRVNAPWLPWCSCDDVAVTGNTTGTPYRIYPSSFSTAKTKNEDYTIINDSLVTTKTIHDGNTQFNKTILQEDIK